MVYRRDTKAGGLSLRSEAALPAGSAPWIIDVAQKLVGCRFASNGAPPGSPYDLRKIATATQAVGRKQYAILSDNTPPAMTPAARSADHCAQSKNKLFLTL
jgi:hypothetical protein